MYIAECMQVEITTTNNTTPNTNRDRFNKTCGNESTTNNVPP